MAQEGDVVQVRPRKADERIRKKSPSDLVGTVICAEKERVMVVLRDDDIWEGPWYDVWLVEFFEPSVEAPTPLVEA